MKEASLTDSEQLKLDIRNTLRTYSCIGEPESLFRDYQKEGHSFTVLPLRSLLGKEFLPLALPLLRTEECFSWELLAFTFYSKQNIIWIRSLFNILSTGS